MCVQMYEHMTLLCEQLRVNRLYLGSQSEKSGKLTFV